MKTNHFFKEKVIFLIFILAFFSFSLVSAANIGSSDVSGVVITPKVPVIDVNATSVNNSQYLQGYTPTTLGTFLQGLMGWLTKAVADTYYADIKWAYNETYTGGTFNSTYNTWAYNQTANKFYYNQTYTGGTFNSSYVTNATMNNSCVLSSNTQSNVDLGSKNLTTTGIGTFGSSAADSYVVIGGLTSPLNIVYQKAAHTPASVTFGFTHAGDEISPSISNTAGTQIYFPNGINVAGTFSASGLTTSGVVSGRINAIGGTSVNYGFRTISGSLLNTPVAGTWEFVTDDLHFTISTGAARKHIVMDDGTNLVSGRVPFSTTNGRLIDDADLTFATDTLTATKLVGTTSVKAGTAAGFISSDGSTGATGTFTTVDLKTVTVKDGIITSIV